ncbi:MAG: hypothetical protein KC535_01485 [Nanoarchaeota archaeon]|nr:hypothetical protein [Nanoarchaeota archaeon]
MSWNKMMNEQIIGAEIYELFNPEGNTTYGQTYQILDAVLAMPLRPKENSHINNQDLYSDSLFREAFIRQVSSRALSNESEMGMDLTTLLNLSVDETVELYSFYTLSKDHSEQLKNYVSVAKSWLDQ